MAVRLYLSPAAVLSLRSSHGILQGAFPGCPAALALAVWSPRARRVRSHQPSAAHQLPAEPRLPRLLRASNASTLCSPRPRQPGHGYSLSKPRAKLGSGHLPFAPDLTPLSPSWGMEKLKLNGLDRQEGLKCPPYSLFFFQFLGREPAKDCEFQMTYRHERTSGITLVFLEIISEKSQPLLLLWDLPDRSNRMILLVTHICS